MPDIIITPSTGKLEFIDNSAQVTRRHSFTLDQNDGLLLDAPLSAAAVSAPLNIINVTVNNSNVNYPFVLAQSGETGAKNLLMDGAGGTYNPFTNTATIDISGNSATTTLASNSSQLNGQSDSYYTNITARLGYTPVNKAGDTVSGNLTVNGNFSVNGSFTAFSASNIYLTSSNLTVTDNILLMNALTPYQRYAGIQMYDSGSGTLSQFLWDGEGDYFFLTGSSVNGKIITGPDGQTNLSSNYVPKATAGYKLGNSVIYDDGTNVGVGTTVPSTKFHVFGNAEVGDSTADTGLIVRHGAGAAQYGRIRFYSTSTNIHTIHSFPTAWNGGTFLNASAGAMNLQGTNGITFGSWNNIDVAFAQGGNNYFKSNVGIGTTSPAYLLDVSGSSRFGYRTIDNHYFTGSVNISSTLTVSGLTYNESIQVDQFDYFQLQPYVEAGSFPSNVLQRSGGTTPTFTTYTGSTAPFGKVLYNTGYYEAIGDYIPVQAGETLYGEIWALRETGATGTAGGFYCGIARYDKDKNQIDGNLGLTYFISSNSTVPSNSTWTKYSGNTTLPLTHTPYGASVTSDGGPIRYIRPYIIVNNASGTIPTFWSGFKIRKVQLTRDLGNVVVNGNLGIGTTNPNTKFEVSGSGASTIQAIFQTQDSNGNIAYNGGIQLGNGATSQNSQIYHSSAGDNTLTFVSNYSGGTANKFIFSPGGTERVRFQQNGRVGIGTTVPTSSLHIKPQALGSDLLILERYASQAKLVYAYEFAADGYLEVRNGSDQIVSKISGYATTPTYFQSNVGIGTSSPASILDVVGLNASFPTGSGTIQSTGSIVRLRNGNSNLVLDIGGNGGNGNWLQSTNRSDLSVNYPLLLNPNGGNVGIGVTNPAYKLDVNGDTRLLAGGSLRLITSAGLERGTFQATDTTGGGGAGLIIQTSGGEEIVFKDSADVNMVIKGNGNVGIGTTIPTTPLHVVGVISGSSVNATTFNATSFVDSGLQSYGLREYVINFSAQSTASFYPIVIDSPPGTDGTWHHSFSIDEVNQGGAAAYNIHSMYGEVRGQGWTDQPYFHRVFHNFYDSAERSLLGVWRPTTSWYGVVVYVRGGKNYYVRTTSRSVNGYSSATNVGGTVTYAIKNAAGADVSGTSANIAEMLNLINNPSGFYHSDNAYIGTNQAIHLGTTSAPNLSIGGTAANATLLQTPRNIGGVSFNGSADINLPGVNTAGNQNTSGNAATATTASYANNINAANSYSAASITTTGKLEAGGNVIAGGQFSGAGTGLTGTAASLTAGAANSVAWTNVSGRPTAVSSFTNDSLYQYHRTDITSLSSSATNLGQPLGTFDANNATNGPTNAWYNYLSSTHGGYLTSLIANRHRSSQWYVGYKEGPGGTPTNPTWYELLHSGNYSSFTNLTASWATNAVTALNVGNGTITIAAGTGVGVGTTNTFTTNQSGATTVTISNSGVTSNVAGTGISLSGGTGAVTITNSGVTAITTNTGLSTNASATGAVTITNTGVTSNVAGTGISLSGGTGAVTITNSGVTSAVAGTGVGVSAATGAVTFSIGQAVGPANTPSFAGIISSAVTNYAYLQVVDTNNFWITPGNANWGLYFETSAGGLLGGTGDSNRLGFVGAGTARFYVDLNNGNGWFGGALTAAGNISAANLSGTNTGDQTIGNGTITIAAGTGVGVGSSNTFTTNQSGATTVTITNTGVTAITTNTGLSTNTSATGAVTITNTGVTAITTNTGLSTNASATGAVTITNTGVTSITTNTGLSTNASATGAVTITNTGVTSAVAGTGVSVSAGTGAVTFSIGQAVGTGNSPTFAGLVSNGNVGIGTSTLDANCLATFKTSNTARVCMTDGTTRAHFWPTGGNFYISTETASDLILITNANERMRIQSGGNVGVGTSTPGQKLDVEGRIRTRGASGSGGFEIGAATTGAAKWRIEWDSASDSLDFNWVG